MAATQRVQSVAIVTGGASGIGRALADELAKRGVDVVIADRQVELAEQSAAAICERGGRARAAAVDVRSFESVRSVVADTVARTGRLDYLFNNAGIVVTGLIERYSTADWDDVFDVNLRGVAHGVQAAYPVMIAQGFGHIINTASVAGLVPTPGAGSYTASKFAVVTLSRALRVEAAHHGVRVSVLCPGAVRTPILSGGVYGRILSEGSVREAQARALERMRPWASDRFARKAVDAVQRDVAVIVIPSWWKLMWYFERFFPGLCMWLAGRRLGMMRTGQRRERC